MIKRIQELDVLRILAMLFVITYHFAVEYGFVGIPVMNLFCTTPNYDFGNVAVTIFLILSGGLLYKKYGDLSNTPSKEISLQRFYKKRALAIYPPFWILSLYIPFSLLRHALTDGNTFALAHPLTLLLTLIGFDGYVKLYGVSTYAFCGDWFVGAIVFLYLLYPLLAKVYRKAPIVTLSVLTVLYALQFWIPAPNFLLSAYPFTLLFKFCLGFALVENLEKLRSSRTAIISAIVFIVLSFIDIPGSLNTDCFGTIAAIALFVFGFYLAPSLLRNKAVGTSVQKIAPLSYCVFLVQHVAILWSQAAYIQLFAKLHLRFTEWNVAALLAVTILLILLIAYLLNKVTRKALTFL
ncbi:MAG: acyltransferase [Hallerella succinigenes]|uniref:acyltransferase family protein n=1 Tax=Hallerella succinigenes TaxID=1896222 RepID=UPI0023F0CDCA|nr:acyltransferase [Hallerella succinigenes]MDD6091910.1 acyltransferase [Hallerella succinigenes]